YTLLLAAQQQDLLARLGGPDAGGVVPRGGGDAAAVGAERGGDDAVGVAAEDAHLLAGLDVPQPDRPVGEDLPPAAGVAGADHRLQRGDQAFAVGAELDGVEPKSRHSQGAQQPAGGDFPDTGGLVVGTHAALAGAEEPFRRRDEQPAVGAE